MSRRVVKIFNAWDLLGWVLLLVIGLPMAGSAAPRQKLSSGHVPAVVNRLAPTGNLPATNRLNLAIGLPLRNEQELDSLLKQLYDPASPNYHHYLTPEEFTARFGPTENDYQSVIEFAKVNGLTPTVTHPNRVVLDVEGAVTDIQKAFHTTLRTYRHPREAREFYAPDVEPSVELAVPILHISGLDNYSLPHSNLKIRPTSNAANPTPNVGTGPSGAYRGSDFRKAYVPGTTLTGAGQSVGLLQFDGFYINDITTYETATGLPHVPLTVVPIDGGVGTPGTGNDEVSLDIEMAISMAPGLARIYVYEAPIVSPNISPETLCDDLLSRMANDNLSRQLSSSWTLEDLTPNRTAQQIFRQMASQGQSFFNASGDSDSFTEGVPVPFPSDSPNITVVGGTMLFTDPGGAYIYETAWNRGLQSDGSYVGSSGGISTFYEIPYYQQGISMVANLGSVTLRNVPDVALTAENVYVVHGNGKTEIVGGTSCAAPLWAGFTALVNQQAAAVGLAPVGFINPALYAIGKSADYTTAFNDITTGNNFSGGIGFSAVTGFDLCTGWGTPNGTGLINLLTRLDPWIISQPQNQTVNAGDSAIFSVTPGGKPPFSYQWTFNGTIINTATNATYSIARVQTIQAGTYGVTVSNPYGTVASDSVTLAINAGSGVFGVVGAPFNYHTPTTIFADRYRASAMPPGLHFDVNFGTISGTPGRSGTYSVIVLAKSNYQSETVTINITIADGEITSPTSAFGIVGVPFIYQISADNYPNRYSASALPPELHFDPHGVIYGTPYSSGRFPIIVEAKNNYESESATVILSIVDGAITGPAIIGGSASQPMLSIIRTPDGILLSWPSTSDGFVLEESQVQPIAWTNSSAPVMVQGNENVAPVAAGGTAKLYRLRK